MKVLWKIWADGAPKFGAEFFEKTVFLTKKWAFLVQKTPNLAKIGASFKAEYRVPKAHVLQKVSIVKE